MDLRRAAQGCRPIMKWAGGKTQLLPDLLPSVPQQYGRYIEPFFGGGALFFAIEPRNAVISDSNPELINMYRRVAGDVDGVIAKLKTYENDEGMYYEIRAQDWTRLPETEAAARTLYLNRTCFNGLYRVNRKGEFNTPFAHYKNPKICNEDDLRRASALLRSAEIVCGDYSEVLDRYAESGDFVFLDPPYVPISRYSDFNRYTKEQFEESDQRRLAEKVAELKDRGCHVVLTNSNHPLVSELYGDYKMTVVQTKRHVSCNGKARRGEDVIVEIPSDCRDAGVMPDQVAKYPPTRYMGSKQRLLSAIWNACSGFELNTAVDLFSGSGVVSYMLKSQGVQVISNDYMSMSAVFTKALVENNSVTLDDDTIRALLLPNACNDGFVSRTFNGIYFSDEDNAQIDNIRANIKQLADPYERAIALMALIRACTKKRPRGIFTYTGQRYDDGRRDLQLSIAAHFIEAVGLINDAVFDNGKQNLSLCGDALDLKCDNPDLVYMDPPYYSKHSDNEYVRRYHFLEGIARDWRGVEIQEHTKTKKFKSYPTPFASESGAIDAFKKLFAQYADSVIVVSYSSNSLPDRETITSLLSEHKERVAVIPIDYVYSFGNQGTAKTHRNAVKEFLFVGY